MNLRIPRHIMTSIIFMIAYFFLGQDVSIEQTLLFGLIYLVISLALEFIVYKIRQNRPEQKKEQTLLELPPVEPIIDAVGGASNIKAITAESTRIKLQLDDVDLINQEELKTIATEGAYLAGDQLQISYKEHATEIAERLQKELI